MCVSGSGRSVLPQSWSTCSDASTFVMCRLFTNSFFTLSTVAAGGNITDDKGKVLKLVGDRVIVEKVAMIKRHSRATQANPQGGIIEKEGTIHISNVALFDDKLGRGTRTKNVVDGDAKVRVGVKSGTKFADAGMG